MEKNNGGERPARHDEKMKKSDDSEELGILMEQEGIDCIRTFGNPVKGEMVLAMRSLSNVKIVLWATNSPDGL